MKASYSTTLDYLRLRISKLNKFEKVVALTFDEIYVYQTVEYDNGKFVGLTASDGQAVKTVLCFMIHSLSGKFSDVVAMIPLAGMKVGDLREHFMQVMKLVVDAGFSVVVAMADNHPVNRSFLMELSGGDMSKPIHNPCDKEHLFFLMIDPVHTIKNIYNNFQKAAIFKFPENTNGLTDASFNHIRALYHHVIQYMFELFYNLSQISTFNSLKKRKIMKL